MTDPEHYLKHIWAMARAECERSGHKLIRDQDLPESFQGRCSRCGHRPGGDPEYQITGDVTGGTWQLTRDGVPITGAIPYNAAVGPWFGFGCGCTDHGRNCEPPSELCCENCPEAAHQMGDARIGRHMADGSTCSNPDLSGFTTTYTPTVPDSATNLWDDLQRVIDVWVGRARPGQFGPDRD